MEGRSQGGKLKSIGKEGEGKKLNKYDKGKRIKMCKEKWKGGLKRAGVVGSEKGIFQWPCFCQENRATVYILDGCFLYSFTQDMKVSASYCGSLTIIQRNVIRLPYYINNKICRASH